MQTEFADPAVAAVFDGWPEPARGTLLQLRTLILETAAATAGVGDLNESLKWGEPSYVPVRPRVGTAIRLGWKAKAPEQCALYVNCRTDLIERFCTAFADALEFEGSRAVVFPVAELPPQDILQVCIEAALTYHRQR